MAGLLCASAVSAESAAPLEEVGFTLLNPTPVNKMRELSADRPDKTDCPFTVDAGHFQVEMDFANLTYDNPNSVRGKIQSEDYQIAPMSIKIGLVNNVDLQLVLSPYQWEVIRDERLGSVQQRSGFGDLTPRAKVNVVGNDGGFFALAFIPFLKLPTNQDHLGNHAVEGGLGVPFAFDVPKWDIGFQTTFNFAQNGVGGAYHTEIANSVSIGHAVVGELSYHGEFFGSVSTEENTRWLGTFDTWFTFQANKNLCLDAGVYIGLTKTADDWHPWVGMTWRN
jgi:Putative MetA-pathway of phenol degradation